MSKLRILAEFAVTRAEIGSFRQVKTNTRSNDYCRCIFEQELGTLECIAAWICLAKGPALRLPSGTTTTMIYDPSNRHLRIQVDASLAEGLCWQRTPTDSRPCSDPTEGELARVHAIDLYLSRLVDASEVQHTIGKMSTVALRSRMPSSQSTECSPFMSPSGVLSPSFSEDTLWMPSGESTPNRFHSSYQRYLDMPEKYASDENRDSLEPSTDSLSKGLGIVQSPKQGTQLCDVPETEAFRTLDLSSSDSLSSSSSSSSSPSPFSVTRHCQDLAESIQVARGRSIRSSRHEMQHSNSTQSRPATEKGDNSHKHSLLLALLQVKANSPLPASPSSPLRAVSQERQTVTSRAPTPTERSHPTSPSGRQRCASHQGLSWLQWQKPEVTMPLACKRARRQSCDGRLESRPFLSRTKSVAPLERHTSSKSRMVHHTKRSPLTISTDVARRNSLRDTSMSSVSVGNSDRRQSISSIMSDISDSSLYRGSTSFAGISNNTHASGVSDMAMSRKGGPPVHYTLMCWIGGRWPCKLRPLIKRNNLQDIHAMLRRNLRLPSTFFIDIEFDWEGDTYVILDASHWQWAREQVHFGDMSVRCHIWKKKYSA